MLAHLLDDSTHRSLAREGIGSMSCSANGAPNYIWRWNGSTISLRSDGRYDASGVVCLHFAGERLVIFRQFAQSLTGLLIGHVGGKDSVASGVG